MGNKKFSNVTFKSLMLLLCVSILMSACSAKQNIPGESSEIASATIFINSETPISVMAHKLTDTKFRENVAALTQTKFPHPKETSTAIPPQIPAMFENTAILATNIGHDIFLIDIETGIKKQLLDRNYPTFMSWENNGCNFLIHNDSQNVLDIVDLDGAWKETVFSTTDLEIIDPDAYIFDVFLSPDQNWIWYWHVSGNPDNERGPEYRYEIQEIFTISRDLEQGPYRISANGGGWEASWSPDSEYIAFSDLDENGALQIFIATKEGKLKKQITNFNDNAGEIAYIEWSPDGDSLAIVFYYGEFATTIVELENNSVLYQQENARFLWWIDNSNVFIRYESSLQSYDLQNNQQIYAIQEIDYPHIRQFQPFVYPHLAGFFARDELDLFVFDGLNGTVTQFSTVQAPIDLVEWTTTPVDFPGLDFCLEKSIPKIQTP
jgi:hypothetical protein